MTTITRPNVGDYAGGFMHGEWIGGYCVIPTKSDYRYFRLRDADGEWVDLDSDDLTVVTAAEVDQIRYELHHLVNDQLCMPGDSDGAKTAEVLKLLAHSQTVPRPTIPADDYLLELAGPVAQQVLGDEDVDGTWRVVRQALFG